MNKLYFCRNFFLIDWRHKRKNTIDLLLVYGEPFYGFSESFLHNSFFCRLVSVPNCNLNNVSPQSTQIAARDVYIKQTFRCYVGFFAK